MTRSRTPRPRSRRGCVSSARGARGLEAEGVVRLESFRGIANRWVLLLRLAAEDVGFAAVWHEPVPSCSCSRSVLELYAPALIAPLEVRPVGGQSWGLCQVGCGGQASALVEDASGTRRAEGDLPVCALLPGCNGLIRSHPAALISLDFSCEERARSATASQHRSGPRARASLRQGGTRPWSQRRLVNRSAPGGGHVPARKLRGPDPRRHIMEAAAHRQRRQAGRAPARWCCQRRQARANQVRPAAACRASSAANGARHHRDLGGRSPGAFDVQQPSRAASRARPARSRGSMAWSSQAIAGAADDAPALDRASAGPESIIGARPARRTLACQVDGRAVDEGRRGLRQRSAFEMLG